jgi:hypothetical protein
VRSRRRPSTAVQVEVLIAQDNRCLYCGHRFGDLVIRRRDDWQWLELNWDHFVPFAYSNRNLDDNWVAACHLCNSYKSSLFFPDVQSARLHILDQAIRHEHDPLPFWYTGDIVAAENDYHPEPASENSTDEDADVSLATDEEIAADGDAVDQEPDSDLEQWATKRVDRQRLAARRRSLRRTTQRPVNVNEWLAVHGEKD